MGVLLLDIWLGKLRQCNVQWHDFYCGTAEVFEISWKRWSCFCPTTIPIVSPFRQYSGMMVTLLLSEGTLHIIKQSSMMSILLAGLQVWCTFVMCLPKLACRPHCSQWLSMWSDNCDNSIRDCRWALHTFAVSHWGDVDCIPQSLCHITTGNWTGPMIFMDPIYFLLYTYAPTKIWDMLHQIGSIMCHCVSGLLVHWRQVTLVCTLGEFCAGPFSDILPRWYNWSFTPWELHASLTLARNISLGIDRIHLKCLSTY